MLTWKVFIAFTALIQVNADNTGKPNCACDFYTDGASTVPVNQELLQFSICFVVGYNGNELCYNFCSLTGSGLHVELQEAKCVNRIEQCPDLGYLPMQSKGKELNDQNHYCVRHETTYSFRTAGNKRGYGYAEATSDNGKLNCDNLNDVQTHPIPPGASTYRVCSELPQCKPDDNTDPYQQPGTCQCGDHSVCSEHNVCNAKAEYPKDACSTPVYINEMGTGELDLSNSEVVVLRSTSRTTDNLCQTALTECIKDSICDGVRSTTAECEEFQVRNDVVNLPLCDYNFKADGKSKYDYTILSEIPCAADQSCKFFQCPIEKGYYRKNEDLTCKGFCTNNSTQEFYYAQDRDRCCNPDENCSDGNIQCKAGEIVDTSKKCLGKCSTTQLKLVSDQEMCCKTEQTCCNFNCAKDGGTDKLWLLATGPAGSAEGCQATKENTKDECCTDTATCCSKTDCANGLKDDCQKLSCNAAVCDASDDSTCCK
jgi:hypothetical protein